MTTSTSGKPTYYRRRNDDTLQHEIIVRSPNHGTQWDLTITSDDTPFNPAITVHVSTDSFPAYTHIPDFFRRLAERAPTTLDQLAAILDELGIPDETAAREQERARTAALTTHDPDDGWPYL
ncbi:hypothetical protein [Nonomuraea sp. NPDC003214]